VSDVDYELEFKLAKKRLDKASLDWARAKADYENLKEYSDVFLANLKNSISLTSDKVSEVKLDRMALSTEEFKEYIKGLGEARKVYIASEAEWQNAKLWHESLRTLASLEKSKMNIL